MLRQKFGLNILKKVIILKSEQSVNTRRYVSADGFEWPSEKVRQTFIDFFCQENRHKFIKSSSVLPKKGSGTYFTNAGMNQFKSIILGETDPADIIETDKYIGVANSQRCIRIGGKHNDLEDIGKDTYHHTFFEMLGNWSFGSYDNEQACQLALDLLVNKYKLNINGLYFTYFSGDANLGLAPDLKSKNVWLKLGIPERQILPFDSRANFWEMDIVGPCGPCTEIHYDRMVDQLSRPEQFAQARQLVNAGQERVIELWNLVFMNYNRTGPKNFSPLPFQVVDTGMGLERLTTVLNNLHSNYDSDLFIPLFENIYTRSQNVPHYAQLGANDPMLCSYRTLSDFARSITVSINDGLVPSRNGLGGFLKFLILKSLKISKEVFNIENEAQFLSELVMTVVNSLKTAYPELAMRSDYIKQVVVDTHQKHKVKVKNSNQIAERFIKKIGVPSELSGDQIWKLFKGDGTGEEVSIDFIQDFCTQKNIRLDIDSFEKILLSKNEKALKNLKNTRDDKSSYIDLAKKLSHLEKTDNYHRYNYILDENKKEAMFNGKFEAKILAIAVPNQNGTFDLRNQIEPDQDCVVVLDRTNFYHESGGQQSDIGKLSTNSNCFIDIKKVLNLKGLSFHIGKSNSTFKINDEVNCEIDGKLRYFTTLNHTGVHLLNHSIRKLYQNENSILQTSSTVKDNYFKFEFKFNEILPKPKVDDIEKLESQLNKLITKSIPVKIEENLSIEDRNFDFPVRKLNDVLYPRKLRMVTVGVGDEDGSGELCCGSHVDNTSRLEKLCITSFSVVGDSSYEIEGCTSKFAEQIEKTNQQVLDLLAEMIELNKNKNEGSLSNAEVHACLNDIADRSIQIEAIFKKDQTSYLTMHRVKAEANRHRPSKNVLLNSLKNFLLDELGEGSRQSLDSILIASIDPKVKLSFKFIAFDSVLHHEQILSVISKISSQLHPYLIIYNKYRNVYIFYSRDSLKESPDVNKFFNTELEKIMNKNSDARILDESDNFRIVK
ncbi:alanine--tRNA cytoplasmic, partial [Brachionus plicatilis]